MKYISVVLIFPLLLLGSSPDTSSRKTTKIGIIRLVRMFVTAKARGANPPEQKFWVHINDQRANPWNSKMGMTWKLKRVEGDVCLVGQGKHSNSYQGDTSRNEKLSILCIRKRKLIAPEGIPIGFHRGWTGAEIRLTLPIAGTALTSLEAANKIVRKEFGKDWQMAEFHDGNGGWNWWAYWKR